MFLYKGFFFNCFNKYIYLTIEDYIYNGATKNNAVLLLGSISDPNNLIAVGSNIYF